MLKGPRVLCVFASGFVFLLLFGINGWSQPVMVSVNSTGEQADNHSDSASISKHGRYVAFTSDAGNLDTLEDTSAGDDVYVRDIETGITTRVSVNGSGVPGDDDSWEPSISANGRHIAFTSAASNFSSDARGYWNVFVHDCHTGATFLVSKNADGVGGNMYDREPSISADGSRVAFASNSTNLVDGDSEGHTDVFIRFTGGATRRVSVSSTGEAGNNNSYNPSLSTDGNYVAFESWATNLTGGAADTNTKTDIFLHHITSGSTYRLSQNASGVVGDDESSDASVSTNGRYVAFQSAAGNLVDEDTNGVSDIFVYDLGSGGIERVSVSSDGTQGNNFSYYPSISANGRYVAYYSYATNLVDGDTNGHADIFMHDRSTGKTTRLSMGPEGVQGNSASIRPALSAYARYAAFESLAGNLVPGDAGGLWDVFRVNTGVIFILPGAPLLLTDD
jgi:Tol biopolymer transport system component